MRFLAALILALGLASPAAADEGLDLTGKWGIGFDSITGASAGTGLVPGFTQPNAASVRYWINDKFSWEGDLALSANSQPGAPPAGGTTTTLGWGVGTLMKYNFAKPGNFLLAQFLGGASFAQLGQKNDGGSGSTPSAGQTTTTFSLLVGTGFEAFMPFWKALSVEGNLGLRVSTSQTKTEGQAQATASNSSLGISGNGFSPLNVALHYYF